MPIAATTNHRNQPATGPSINTPASPATKPIPKSTPQSSVQPINDDEPTTKPEAHASPSYQRPLLVLSRPRPFDAASFLHRLPLRHS